MCGGASGEFEDDRAGLSRGKKSDAFGAGGVFGIGRPEDLKQTI
ncbi:hypothetical protein [Azospirillum palustre]